MAPDMTPLTAALTNLKQAVGGSDAPAAGDDKAASRTKWYEEAPLCPECGENRVSVGQAIIGFFGLNITYFDRCDECLPPEVAEYSREVRANLLSAEAAS